MRSWVCLLVFVAYAVGCDDGDGTRATDASSADGGERDAAAEDAGIPAELRDTVTSVLAQFDRQAAARCRCQVHDGDFASQDECVAAIGNESKAVDCLVNALAKEDSDELRLQLQCQGDALEQRTTCFESSSCEPADIGACSTLGADCPQGDPQLFTRVLRACPDAVLPK